MSLYWSTVFFDR